MRLPQQGGTGVNGYHLQKGSARPCRVLKINLIHRMSDCSRRLCDILTNSSGINLVHIRTVPAPHTGVIVTSADVS